MQKFWDEGFLGNSWQHWATLGVIIVGTLLLSWVLRALLIVRLRKVAKRTVTRWDDMALLLIEKTHFWFLLVVGLHLGMQSMELHPKVARTSEVLFLLIVFAQLGIWLTNAATFVGKKYTEDTFAVDKGRATTMATMVFLLQMGIWIVVSLLLIGNLGYNVSALLAGLGVGGIAVALAVQNILSDLFGSLSIVLDKPFVLGDFIAVGDEIGTVEHIGLKTTRLKSLSGEQLIFSNSDLLKSRIRNYKRMGERRVEFNFGLQYLATREKLDLARNLVKEVIDSQPDCRFERCHLAKFGNMNLDFETVYWVNKRDYLSFINAHHDVSVRISESFRRHGIFFSYAAPAAIPEELKNAKQETVRA
ncbi:MAG: mechanosensitive ion channel family protein [Bdellovibrionota bacterium]